MIQNIEKVASERGISRQDALQVFMQVVALKNLLTKEVSLIGGTALVMGHGNPRFSEDIDLAGVDDPLRLKNSLNKAAEEMGLLLGATTQVRRPKPGGVTWRLLCDIRTGFSAQLHVDTQHHDPLTHHPVMVVYHGMPPFVFSSIELKEIMADKLVALAFRNYASGRDIFDLWFHWLKGDPSPERDADIMDMVRKKLFMRNLQKEEFLKNARTKMDHGISKRVEEEWERYLPVTLKKSALYKAMFARVSEKIGTLKL